MKIETLLLCILFVFGMAYTTFASFGTNANLDDPFSPEIVVAQSDTIPLKERYGDFITNPGQNPFDLNDPSIVEKNVEYDPVSGQYIITEKIGDDYFRMPSYMSFEEYMDHRAKEQEKAYFDELAGLSTGDGKAGGRLDPMDRIDISDQVKDRLFGGNAIDIRPQGNIDLTFGVDFNRLENPNLTIRQQRQGGFDFDMDIQMNVTGKIGDKLNLSTNYNTQATFDFENQMKLEYNTDVFGEDDIIRKIEAGNVTFPLRSSLIQGSQSLFGIATELQFGRLKIGAVASQQKSEQENITIEGGSQIQEFEVNADQYDENRHFFLTHYNRAVFEDALTNLPQIRSLFKVIRLDVWITNDRNETQNPLDIVAFTDLGEPTVITNENPNFQAPMVARNVDISGIPLPGKNIKTGIDANDLYETVLNNGNVRQLDRSVAELKSRFNFKQGQDFEKRGARLLNSNEYSLHPELGFISLNVNLQPDQVLAVAFEYEYNGETYQVGEFNKNVEEGSDELQVRFVKLLKSTIQQVDLPAWDLMMKNHYSIGAFQVNEDDFLLDIFYLDPGKGDKRFIPEAGFTGIPLLRLFNLDTLNVQGDPCPDGIFDFVPGLTINPRNGRIMFPVLEPFGDALGRTLNNADLDSLYTYRELYDLTPTFAREYPEKNRFVIKGSYKSSTSSEISLGAFNLPEGSVTVRAGGTTLEEGADYEIDYNIGRIKILNDAYISSGVPINVSFEDNTLFGFQTKTMIGLRADYEINKNFNIGGTYLHLFERPFTQKVNIGDDPINNRVYGLDVNYSTKAPWLTKAVDAIPFINTKAESNITISAEVAALRPGHSSAIDQGGEEIDRDGDGKPDRVIEKRGTVYLDDFEGTTSGINLGTPANSWVLASVPQKDFAENGLPLFPESDLENDLNSGVNRAKLNWYRLDRTVQGADQGNNYTELIEQEEVFPSRSVMPGFATNLGSFDLTYYPDERGPYNYDPPEGVAGISAGLTPGGGLRDPESRWAGIMRSLNTNDFEAANYEFIEFWVLNPFMNTPNGSTTLDGGELVFNLGNVSEDILKDSRRSFENGIPTSDTIRTDTTKWARVSRTNAITNAFDNNPDNRVKQDLGFDGLNNIGERQLFNGYLAKINNPSSGLNPGARERITNDPSNDDFVYFLDPGFAEGTSILERYSRFNNPENNSPISNGTSSTVQSFTTLPDSEDLNRDNSLDETESYYRYRIPIEPTETPSMVSGETEIKKDGNPFITDEIFDEASGRTWYRFKVPLNKGVAVGDIQNFRSIRFIRMYMKGFEDQITLRFAKIELVRNQWRQYRRALFNNAQDTVGCGGDVTSTAELNVNAVSIEENEDKIPFGYVLPLGIVREQSLNTTFANLLQNEQSLSMEVENLTPCFDKAIFKRLDLDMRLYKRLEMFVHAESGTDDLNAIPDNDLALFIRLGSDYTENYYEYEVPLVISTDPNIGGLDAYREEVWKEINSIDIPLEAFKNAKLDRNASTTAVTDRFEIPFSDTSSTFVASEGNIYVIGNPNLGDVEGVMIGIRNLADMSTSYTAEVWINELRLSGINERGGVAALAQVDIQMADFGNATFATNYSSFGWGGLEQNVLERARDEVFSYDISTRLELGKFFSEKTGIKIPFYAQYSKTKSTPEFDPYDKDVTLDEKIELAATEEEKDEIKERALDVIEIKAFNFTNVRKERTDKTKKPKPWNIENFSFTYGFSETTKKNPVIESDKSSNYTGSIDYNYTRKATYFSPFKKLSKSKYLKLITEFGINPIPNSYSFSTTLNREFQETRYRFVEDAVPNKDFYNKQFTWDRTYNLQWDLTKNLKFGFSAINQAVIDELKEVDGFGVPTPKSDLRAEVWKNLKNFGRNKQYGHDMNLDYKVPLKNIPFLDWIKVTAKYRSDYSWTAASRNTLSLGNVIQNGQVRQLNGDIDFEGLYKKSKYLAKINKKRRKSAKGKRGGRNNIKNKKGKGDDSRIEGDDAKGKVKTEAKNKREKDKEEETVKVESKDKGDKSGGIDEGGGKKKLTKEEKKAEKAARKKKRKNREPSVVERILLRPLMLVRKGRISYSQTFSTVIPGYLPSTSILGQNKGFDAPGWGFIAGFQPNINATATAANPDYLIDAANKGWITDDVFLNQRVEQNRKEDISANLKIEPFADFKIDLDINRSFTENTSVYFKDFSDDGLRNLEHRLPREMGQFTISYFNLNTLTKDSDELFAQFDNNRRIISDRIGAGDHLIEEGFANGYGGKNNDILLPAFFAAYTGKDAKTIEISRDYARDVLFKELPRINWRLNYGGLSKIPMFANIFASFSLTHGYQSTMTVNGYQTNLNYSFEQPLDRDHVTGNFFSRFEIPAISINEQFSPLLGIQATLKNDMTFNLNFKKTRNLRLNLIANPELQEAKTTEYVIGFGYRIKDVVIGFLKGGKKKKGKKRKSKGKEDDKGNGPGGAKGKNADRGSDLNFAFDFSFRDDVTLRHDFNDGEVIPTRGTKTISINPSIDYDINKQLNARLFFDYRRTVPKNSEGFPQTNFAGGITIRFSLN